MINDATGHLKLDFLMAKSFDDTTHDEKNGSRDDNEINVNKFIENFLLFHIYIYILF